MLADLLEWLGILIAIPVSLVFIVLAIASIAFVYVDAQQRWHSTPVAVLLAVGVWLFLWPLSFFAYVFHVARLDRERGIPCR